jgi:hypothetical protein
VSRTVLGGIDLFSVVAGVSCESGYEQLRTDAGP